MTIVLDSGGLSMLAANRARLAELRRRGEWPAVLPDIVCFCATASVRLR